MPADLNIPVLVGGVPLFCVTRFQIAEGYKVSPIAGSALSQMVAPTTKTVTIDALLIGEQRAFRPLLEAVALTSRFLGPRPR